MKNMYACMEKPTGEKTPGTRRGTIPCAPTEVNILWHPGARKGTIPYSTTHSFCGIIFQRHYGYITIPTSGNILMQLFPMPLGKLISCNCLFLQLCCPLRPSLLCYYIQLLISDKDPSSLIMLQLQLQHPIQYQCYHLYMTPAELNCCWKPKLVHSAQIITAQT